MIMCQLAVRDFEKEGATSSLGESIHTYLMIRLVKHIEGTDVGFGFFSKRRVLISRVASFLSTPIILPLKARVV